MLTPIFFTCPSPPKRGDGSDYPLARGRAAAMGLALVLACAFASPARCSPPRVVVTIKPIHSIAAAVLDGVTTPKLLISGAASPHTYALKPSDAQTMSAADTIIRVSSNLEVFLNKSIETLGSKSKVLTVVDIAGLTVLPARDGGKLVTLENATDDDDHGDVDVHVWLDPANGAVIAEWMAREFSASDPANASLYRANAERFKVRLSQLDAELRSLFQGLSTKPFIVFHDVTQYLERRYGLNGLGAVTLSPEREPGARRLSAIRDRIAETASVCVFSEPQFPPRIITTLVDGTSARQGVIDEVGVNLDAGPDEYVSLLRQDAQNLANCLRS